MFTRKCLSGIMLGKSRRISTLPGFVEVKIPVPWGHIAGKWWGPTDQRPILTLHGWQDNCGSFDLLIPKLPKTQSFLAVDFMGHGHSSKLPPGLFYYTINGVMLIKALQAYFKWDKISLMGHSLGGITSYSYGFLFPSAVDFIICIDGFHTLIESEQIETCVSSIEELLKYDAQNSSSVEPPSYTRGELAERLRKGSKDSIDLDKTKYILERNVKVSATNPQRFYFNRDARLKCGVLLGETWTAEQVVEAAGRISFPLFVSKAEKSPLFTERDCFPQVYEVLKRSPGFEFHEVPGTHHGHLNTPEIYKDIIPKFLSKFNTHDRTQVPVIDQIRATL